MQVTGTLKPDLAIRLYGNAMVVVDNPEAGAASVCPACGMAAHIGEIRNKRKANEPKYHAGIEIVDSPLSGLDAWNEYDMVA